MVRRNEVTRSGARWWSAAVLLAAGLTVASCHSGRPAAKVAPTATTTTPTTEATTATSTAPTTAAPTTTSAPAASQALCGAGSEPPAQYAHVVWIVMENHSYKAVIGSRQAPFQTDLARQCASVSGWATVGSPSLPNYIGLTSGSTFGIADDGGPSSHPITADNLFRQVRAAGKTERSYLEDMPGPCSAAATRTYAVKHNPAVYYIDPGDAAACRRDDLPLGSVSAGNLASDLAAGTLPNFAVITPNLCHDTHDCGVATGDAWLQQWIPKLTATPGYRAGDTAIVVIYDEYTPVPNLFLAPSVQPGPRSIPSVNQYALLRLTEDLLGLPGHLGSAQSAPDLRAALHI